MTRTFDLDKYFGKHPEVKEWLEVWGISKEEYYKALKQIENESNYPLGMYGVNSDCSTGT